jgi:peptidoglycan/xylan/chitin deacetylase (PgdA/CDA1 family)
MKTVALTFDDGPGIHTLRILDILKKHDVIATFFVLGMYVNSEKSTVKRAFDMGCEIANHTWSHPNLTEISAEEIKKELEDTSSVIESVTGVLPQIFRPPYGVICDTLQKTCAEVGLPIIIWSVDPKDWESRNTDDIFNTVTEKIHNKAIILCHDVYASTSEAVERLVPELLRLEYKLVTVSELMKISKIELSPGEIYHNG